MDVLGYYAMCNKRGCTLWLAEDEETWTVHFTDAREFHSKDEAENAANHAAARDDVTYVFACLH